MENGKAAIDHEKKIGRRMSLEKRNRSTIDPSGNMKTREVEYVSFSWPNSRLYLSCPWNPRTLDLSSLLQRIYQNDYQNDERYRQANYDEHQFL